MPLLGDAPHRRNRIVHHFVRFRLAVCRGDVGAVGCDRRSRSDIRAGSHVGEVGGKRDICPGAGRLGAGRPNPDDRRNLGVERLDDALHRVRAAARRIQLDDHGGCTVRFGLANRASKVAGHDVIHDATRVHDYHLRRVRVRRHARGARRGRGRDQVGRVAARMYVADQQQKRTGDGKRRAEPGEGEGSATEAAQSSRNLGEERGLPHP